MRIIGFGARPSSMTRRSGGDGPDHSTSWVGYAIGVPVSDDGVDVGAVDGPSVAVLPSRATDLRACLALRTLGPATVRLSHHSSRTLETAP